MAKKKKKAEHIHKYKRVRWGKNGTIIWRCMLPNCPHYLHTEMARNRVSLCWKCQAPFALTPEKLLREKPKCDGCQHSGRPDADIMSQLDRLLLGL